MHIGKKDTNMNFVAKEKEREKPDEAIRVVEFIS